MKTISQHSSFAPYSENQQWLAALSDGQLQFFYGLSTTMRMFHKTNAGTKMHEDLRLEMDVRGHHPHHFDESADNLAVTDWLKRKREQIRHERPEGEWLSDNPK